MSAVQHYIFLIRSLSDGDDYDSYLKSNLSLVMVIKKVLNRDQI